MAFTSQSRSLEAMAGHDPDRVQEKPASGVMSIGWGGGQGSPGEAWLEQSIRGGQGNSFA